MTAQAVTADRPKQDSTPEQQLQKLREAYADAPEVGRVALEGKRRPPVASDCVRAKSPN
jgi:hypothetical protein